MGWGDYRKTNDLGAIKDAASDLIARGYAVCALDPESKTPSYDEWPITLLTPDDFEPGEGIGLMTGAVSGSPGDALVAVDLDSRDAVHRADAHLPATPMMEGRRSKPNSHRYFRVPLGSIPPDQHSHALMSAEASVERYGHPGPRTRHFAGVLDLLGTGAQAACPPTLHESGEVREWTGGSPGEPAVVPYPDLLCAVDSLLSACGYTAKKKVAATSAVAPLFDRDADLFAEVDSSLRHRITRYLDKCPPAVSGDGGHGRTFAVACALVWGFALDPETALELLADHYNPRCTPPWSIAELQHKVEDANKAASHQKPRGWLLNGPRKATTLTFSSKWINV